jgi:DNA-binding transcriptional MerR regulator
MSDQLFKVGDLARRTGVTVRTLHHYDDIGLLTPSIHSDGGYRLYTEADVRRLQQIVSLRSLGFRLEEIKECMAQSLISPLEVIQQQMSRLQQQIEMQQVLWKRLADLTNYYQSTGEVSVEDFLLTIEAMTMFEKHYTQEQLAELENRRKELGEERIRQVENEWPQLMALVQKEMDAGTDPADPKVQALAKRWMSLVQEFTGGNAGIFKSLSCMYQSEQAVPHVDMKHMRPMMEYMQKAFDTGGIKHP